MGTTQGSFAEPHFGMHAGVRASMARGAPMLVFETPKIPRVDITTPLGAVLAVSGGILTAEALIALFSSQDQSTWATVFRLFRIGLGGGLLAWVAASSR